MSRYQPYPSYKDSGVEWLGKVPEYWGIGLLSSLFSDNKEKNVGLKNSNLLSLSYGNIIQKDIDTSIGLLPESFDSYQIVHPGYIVLRLTDLQNDKKSLRTGFVRESGIITSAYVGLAKKSQSIGNEKYFYLYLHTFDAYKGFYGMGAGVRQGLNFDELKKLKFTLPPLEEQNLIVKYIEKKTAKIDTLIAKQQRMIELLGEKRSALISHAVTKGIDPNVAMKNSGVVWLGEVPEHWEVKKLKYNLRLQTQKVTIDGHNVIALENIESKLGKYVSTESSYQGEDVEFKLGDILFGKLRPYLAKVYKCNSNGVAFGDLLTYRPTKYFDSSFAFYSLLSEEFIKIVDSSTYGAKMPRASSEFINEMLLATPPLPEQIAIAEHLDTQIAKIDTLIAKAGQAIELMKERRIALISAVVTGKIDVRGEK